MNFHIEKKEKVYIIDILDKGKVDIMGFWESKKIFLKAGNW